MELKINVDIQMIRPTGLLATGILRQHAERRLRFALRYAGWCVRRATVHLAERDDRHNGASQRCEIRVMLWHGLGDPVVAVDTAADLYIAIDRAAARAGREVARRVARRASDQEENSRVMSSAR